MKLFKSLLLLSLLSAFFLTAEEEAHVAIGTRQMSEEAKAQIAAEKEKKEPENQEEKGSSGFIFDRYPSIYFSNSHHWLIAVTLLNNDKFSLELEDGSVWKINSYDGVKTLSWRSNDPLTITQNKRWFSGFDYQIINKSDGSSVEANLFLGPLENGSYTRYVIAIDHDHKVIYLSDNTHWEISYLDKTIFRDWALSDAIIIGTNSSWDAASEALLINVNMNNCARAKQF